AEEERIEIFRIHLAQHGRQPENFDLPALVAASGNFSGAEIQEAIISALYDAFYAQRDLTTADVLETLRQTVPLSKTMDEHLSRLRNWAEGRARHASFPRGAVPARDHRRMEF
ncbi:MAG TPA: ATPase, partial [Verrucomicrobiae bacterium]|nr:ATPase [Verrucomicrobiae bacterium]